MSDFWPGSDFRKIRPKLEKYVEKIEKEKFNQI